MDCFRASYLKMPFRKRPKPYHSLTALMGLSCLGLPVMPVQAQETCNPAQGMCEESGPPSDMDRAGIIIESLGRDADVGANGGNGRRVDVQSREPIATLDDLVDGILARSIGGMGGPEATGSKAGDGGHAGRVRVSSSGPIATVGIQSSGIRAASRGGAGGAALAGDGGNGGNGALVRTSVLGRVDTVGVLASAVLLDASGGSGGFGGSNVLGGDEPTRGGRGGDGGRAGGATAQLSGILATNGVAAVGIQATTFGGNAGDGGSSILQAGSGGRGGSAGNLQVRSAGEIRTTGINAQGILAQSFGGAGGFGGIATERGGRGGDGADSGAVSVIVGGDSSSPSRPAVISTNGDGASGVRVLSMGGFGGFGGDAELVAGAGGKAGAAASVDVVNNGTITTNGAFADGIFALSQGGFGGHGGSSETLAGSTGGDGTDGREASVSGRGTIVTNGEFSFGIFAQSLSGLGGDGGLGVSPGESGRTGIAGPVSIRYSGQVIANGNHSDAIQGLSIGFGERNGNISIEILRGGVIRGGASDGVGVRFVDGANNSLVNAGAISALSGRAVVGGDGDEHVINQGMIVGDIDLGGGNNRLENRRRGTIVANSVIALGGGELHNEGTLSISGETELEGAFSQSAEAELVLSGSGSLTVDGRATLGGTLSFASSGFVSDGTRLSVITAEEVRGEFAETPAATPLLALDLARSNTGIQLEARAAPFASVAANGLEATVADYLDSIAAESKGDLNVVLGEFQRTEAARLRQAFRAFDGSTHAQLTRVQISSAERYTQTVEDRIEVARASLRRRADRRAERTAPSITPIAGGAIDTPSIATPRASSQADDLDFGARSAVGARDFQPLGLWLASFGERGHQAGQRGFDAVDHRLSGMALGLQAALGDNSLIGLAGGTSKASAELSGSSGDVRSIFASLFASATRGVHFADLMLSIGHHDVSTLRQARVGGVARIADSSHDARSYSARLHLGTRQRWFGLRASPFVTLAYTRLVEDDLTERGAGGLGLHIDARRSESLFSELGLKVQRELSLPFGRIAPEFGLAWRRSFAIGDRELRTSFLEGPDRPLRIADPRRAPSAVRGSMTLTLRSDGPLSLDLQMDVLLRRGESRRSLNLNLGYAF